MRDVRRGRSARATDLFAGCGGSSDGLRRAGWDIALAANHNPVAIDSHAANFPDTEHLCADISNYDMRRLPWTQLLWASPECTWHSPAGGRKRLRAQLDLLDDYVPTDAGVRSRATAFDVIRATEARAYDVVVVENVVEFADWPLFDWWLDGMRRVGDGYYLQIVCVSAAHIGDNEPIEQGGNPRAPQWRDRLFLVFTRHGVPQADLAPRPPAYCGTCDQVVDAVQSWKRPDRRPVGKFSPQYVYRCPSATCRHQVVDPFVLPAAAAIDWTDLGTRIGDRARPLAASTMRRIQAGLDLYTGTAPFTVPSGGTWRDGPAPVGLPMPARTTRETDGLVCPPFVTVLRNHTTPTAIGRPLAAVTAGGNHHALVVPYRKGRTTTTGEPLHTLATRESAALVQPAVAVEDCRFRMLKPREHLAAQRFQPGYVVKGNQSEQTLQAGNAVPCNVAQWLGTRIRTALAGAV